MAKKLLHKLCDVATGLTTYEHALKAYKKLFSHISKLLNTPERKHVPKTGKKSSITI